MYNPQEIFEQSIVKLEERWIEFKKQAEQDPEVFNHLFKDTLKATVDFRWTMYPDVQNKLLKSLPQFSDKFTAGGRMKETIESIVTVEKWNDPTASSLLTGKLFGRILRSAPLERKLLAEKDIVIQARIEALLQMLQNTDNDESSLMVLNSLETYKKFLICETELQNKITSQTIKSLIKALLIILCHRKEYDHLNSMIKFLPRHRKIQFLTEEISVVSDSGGSNRLHNRRMFICAAILQDLFQSVFKKPREQQKVLMFNLYINLIIDLAKKEKFIDLQLEKILLSATDMNVISDYYYLAADMLRLNMPNQHEDLVVKLISVGLSHDLTSLEQIKYTKENKVPKWNESDFIAVHRKMFLALTTLGFIIKDYSLRRLCIQIASICETETSFCSDILKSLPECGLFNVENDSMENQNLMKLREQLETFQSAIKSNVALPRTWEKASILCYERLDFINGRKVLSDNLEPLVYPGVEKWLKKPQIDSSEEAYQVEEKKHLNSQKLLQESDDFTQVISNRLKSTKTLFYKKSNSVEIPSEVTALMIKVLCKSPDFEIIEGGKVFMKLSRETTQEKFRDYTNHCTWMNEERQKQNKPNLYFNFDLSQVEDPNCTIDSMYQNGVICVNNLCAKFCNMFEIENVMLYAIMEKKSAFTNEEFARFNKNRIYEETMNEAQGAFNFLMFHPIPEFRRLQKTSNLGHYHSSMFQYLCKSYTFDATPGKYKCHKPQQAKSGEDGEVNGFDDTLDESIHEQSKEISPVKKSARKISKIPKPVKIKLPRSSAPIRIPGREVKHIELNVKKETRKKALEYPILKNNETFHGSDALLRVFITIQRALEEMIGEHGLFDLKQMMDKASPHKVMFTYETSSELSIKFIKKRNHRACSIIETKEIEVPARVHGSLEIIADIIDEIVYDENFDNPKLISTAQYKVNGSITFDHMSHSLKNCDLDFIVKDCRSSIKLGMRGGSRSFYKGVHRESASGSDKEGNVSIPKLKSLLSSYEPKPSNKKFSNATKSRIQRNQQNHKQQNFQESQMIRSPIQQTSVQVVNPMISSTNQQSPNPVPTNSQVVQSPESYLSDKNESIPTTFVVPSSMHSSQLPLIEQQTVKPVDSNQRNSQTEQESAIFNIKSTSFESPVETIQPDCPTVVQHESKKPRYDQNEMLVASILLNQALPIQAQNQARDFNIKLEVVPSQPKINNQPSPPIVEEQEQFQILKVQNTSMSNFFPVVNPEKMNQLFMDQSRLSERCDTPKSVQQCDNLLEIKKEPDILTQNGYEQFIEQMNVSSETNLEKSAIDFEAEIPPVVQLRNPNVITPKTAPATEQTPPTSPPPLHYRNNQKEPWENAIQSVKDVLTNAKSRQKIFESSAGRILNNTPPEEEEGEKEDDIIDLTEDIEDLTSENELQPIRLMPYRPRPASKKILPAHFATEFDIAIHTISYEDIIRSEVEKDTLRIEIPQVQKKIRTKKLSSCRLLQNGSKRQRLTSDEPHERYQRLQARESEVRLLDCMEKINTDLLKADMHVTAEIVRLKLPPGREAHNSGREDYQILSCEKEQLSDDPLGFVTDATQSTFHIVFQNCVSYSFDKQFGDGFAKKLTANNQCNEKFSSKPNLLKNRLNNANIYRIDKSKVSNSYYVDNIANNKVLERFANVNLTKTFYSDNYCLNFTKNLKNSKKFSEWSPKLNNDQKNDKIAEKLDIKEYADDDKNLLYQLSNEMFSLIPGLNSFEFFHFPSTPLRSIQVKVIHVYKNLKNGNSSTSCDTSDTDGEQNHESLSLTESFNGESAHSSSTHVQKIGQTSINREIDLKTVQTSFGSIIKNTYPPATLSTRISNGTEVVKSIDKEQTKYTKLKNEDVQIKKITNLEMNATEKPSSNIKIVACSSNSSQVEPQKTNRNQTLINMLTQQVMLPTNSNRHFIITSNKADTVKTDNNVTTVTSALPSHQIVARKVVTSQGQSQLVQILNSPPSSFAMKSIATSVATSQAKLPNQIVTVASQATSNSFKAELPATAKQQGIVQFICKTDGKIIHLTPICNNSAGGSQKKITYKVDTSGAKGPTILHHANQQIIINNPLKKSDNQNILTIIQKQDDGEKKKGPMLTVSQPLSTPTSPISTRSIYEETYAKFIQTSSSSKSSDMGLLTISSSPINTPITSATSSSIIQKIGKTVIQSSNQVLPKFNQAFGKAIFSTNTSVADQTKNKIANAKEILTSRQMMVSFADSKPITKVTRTVSELKSTDANTLLSLIESEGTEKSLPALQTALQNNMLYARPIGNGKLLASNNNNVLLTALRGNNQSNNVRIITSISENINRSSGAIMSPMRISVPIQIPKLINSNVRQQAPKNFRQQIVIATTPTRIQQTLNNQSAGSKLESLLMTTQPTTVKSEVEVEQHNQIKMEPKQKKNVDHSTLEQLREFDMVLEQVLERSSSEITATSMSSPPTPDNSNHLSPKKQLAVETKIKTEMKLNAVTTITSISPSVSPSPKSATTGTSNVAKSAPKLQEDEHTAQRILDILANYKEQVRNSPDLNNKPAPRRRANPPTNPPAAKRKKVVASGSIGSIKSSSKFGSTSDMMTDTMGSEEDSSCGMGSGVASTGSMNNSPQPQDIDDQTDVSMDNNFYMEDSKRETALSPQSSSSSVATSPSHNKFPISRRLILTEAKTSPGSEINPNPCKNIVITSSQPQATSSASLGTSIERLAGHGSTAAVLMPGNYLLPMNVLKGGQQLAILSSNNGQKIIAVPTNQLVGNSCGTSIILQRYLNQASDMSNKTVPTSTSSDGSQNAFKSVCLQQSPSIAYVNHKSNTSGPSGNTLYIRPIQNVNQSMTDTQTLISNHSNLVKKEYDVAKDSQNSKFVSDKTLITEIIQQQQQLAHTQHPQQNFMIKLNEHQPSDPRSSSSIMFVSNSNETYTSFAENKEVAFDNPKIKIEEIDYDDYMKEDAIDLLNETDEMAKSPMLNTKIEVDDNTNSNYESNNLIYDDSVVKMENEQEQKFQHFPIVLSSNHGKAMGVNHVSTSTNIKGFLIDPTNKIVMYNDRKPATIEKEFYNQKSFSEECADLGVDEPIASDLFPEADLLFDSGSPKFDQINTHDGTMHIKKELENGQVLLEMNYNHNMETESWLNFDTEEELVDDTQVVDDVKEAGGGGRSTGHSGDLKAYF